MFTDEILRCLRRLDVSFVVADSTSESSVRGAAARYGKLQVQHQKAANPLTPTVAI